MKTKEAIPKTILLIQNEKIKYVVSISYIDEWKISFCYICVLYCTIDSLFF